MQNLPVYGNARLGKFLSLGTFQKITFSHAKKNHYMMLSSEYIQIDGSVIQDQYSEWKRRLLHENKDKDTHY